MKYYTDHRCPVTRLDAPTRLLLVRLVSSFVVRLPPLWELRLSIFKPGCVGVQGVQHEWVQHKPQPTATADTSTCLVVQVQQPRQRKAALSGHWPHSCAEIDDVIDY